MSFKDLEISSFLATRGIRRGNRGSLYLTVLIIAMVFVNMIFLPSIIMGVLENEKDQIIAYTTGNIMISPKDGEEQITDLQELMDRVNRVPGVARAAPHYSVAATLKSKETAVGAMVTAIRPGDERLVTDTARHMKDGDYLGEGEIGQVIIGIQTAGHKDPAEDMGPTLGHLQVGDPVTIEYTNGATRTYRVKGIIETRSYDADRGVFVSWEEMESVLGYPLDVSTAVLVKTEPGASEPAVKTQLYRFGVQPKVQTWQDLLEDALGRAVEEFSMLNSITSAVSLVIAVVVLFIMITIKALNSRRQIGVLKAIGIDKNIIVNNYAIQVLILTTFGVLLGIVLVEGLVGILTLYPLEFSDGNITPLVTVSDLINNALLIYIAAFVAGYIPAWRIANEEVMTLLRA